jgi:hydroxyacylglutathione hydrolase
MFFKQYYLGCLAHASYLIGDAGEAAVVDPQRDVEEYMREAAAQGLTIRAVIETHLHADFVSGHLELAQRTGAPIYIGARAGASFSHVPVQDGLELRLGRVVLRFLETPGHTPESVSILVSDEGAPDEPAKLLTGDTLFIGDVGRPDLVGARGFSPEQMAGMMYDSLHEKILRLPDEVEVYPAHGAGSACGRFISDERASTIGRERRTNWALQITDRDAFIAQMTADLPPPPPYFQFDAELNKQGAVALGELPSPTCLKPAEFAASMSAGRVLDVRDAAAFGRGHVPGALHISLSGQFAPWAGVLLRIGEPILLVAEDRERAREAMIRLARVGHETVQGCLDMDAWLAAGEPVAVAPQIDVGSLSRRLAAGEDLQVLDVRRSGERAAGHIRGSLHIPLETLSARLGELDRSRPIAVVCGSGYRSSAASSLLQAAGIGDVFNVSGGHAAWRKAGLSLEKT